MNSMYDSDNPDRWLVGGTARLILLGFVLLVVIGGCNYFWSPLKGAIEERNQTVGSGAYRIATYDEYHDMCNAVKASEQRIANFKAQLNTDPPPSPDQTVRLQAAIMAETNGWIDLVNQYNSNADKERTKGQFRDDNLPEHIDPNNLNNGVETNCG